MHYSNIVIVKPEPTQSIKDAVTEAMQSGYDDWWDFWQIGGRWTGFFDEYDPNADDNLLEICDTCGGTGKRTDMVVKDGCNGCHGTGKRRRPNGRSVRAIKYQSPNSPRSTSKALTVL
jgi:hypothetical protein